MKKRLTIKKIIFLVLFSILIVSLVRQENTMNKIQNEMVERQKELEAINEKNLRLKDEVEKVQTDEYTEKLAKERLGMIKPGEKVISNSGRGESSSNN